MGKREKNGAKAGNSTNLIHRSENKSWHIRGFTGLAAKQNAFKVLLLMLMSGFLSHNRQRQHETHQWTTEHWERMKNEPGNTKTIVMQVLLSYITKQNGIRLYSSQQGHPIKVPKAQIKGHIWAEAKNTVVIRLGEQGILIQSVDHLLNLSIGCWVNAAKWRKMSNEQRTKC